MPNLLRIKNLYLFRLTRIPQAHAQKKTIKLGFGQGERSFIFDWVLRSKDHERLWKWICHTIDCHLMFLHRLQQSSLCLRCGAVHFVCEDDLSHNRTCSEFKFARLLVENGHACDVARKHIRRKLDSIERAIQRFCEATRKHRLSHARYILDQNMSLA